MISVRDFGGYTSQLKARLVQNDTQQANFAKRCSCRKFDPFSMSHNCGDRTFKARKPEKKESPFALSFSLRKKKEEGGN